MNCRLGLAVTLFLIRCAQAAPPACSAPPEPAVIAFFEEEASTGEPKRVAAVVEKIDEVEPGKVYRYLLREGEGQRVLVWRGGPPLSGVEGGKRYTFELDYRPGFPDAFTLTVDDGALLLAAMSGQRVFQPPGFEVVPLDSNCPSREKDRCYESIQNRALRFSRSGREVTLFQGQQESLDGFAVHVLVAEIVKYDSRCADAGRPAFCYIIQRSQ